MDHKWPRVRQLLFKVLTVLAVLVLGALWTGAPSLAQDPATFAYTVQPGDTLYKLSQRFGTTVDTLVALNDIRNPDLIFVNQVLLIPAAGASGGNVPTGAQPAPAPSGGPLTFTWERIGFRYEGNDYISTLRITATGGQSPYTYYQDGLVQQSNTFDVAWRRGRSKPGSVGVADATGTYVKEDYWLQDTCDYPPGVEITQPKEGDQIKKYPRNFNIRWVHTIDPPPDAYWIEIQVWQDGGWKPWQMYRHSRGKSELFFVPDEFPGDLAGRLRMWGIYGACEASYTTPWRKFEFRVTY